MSEEVISLISVIPQRPLKSCTMDSRYCYPQRVSHRRVTSAALSPALCWELGPGTEAVTPVSQSRLPSPPPGNAQRRCFSSAALYLLKGVVPAVSVWGLPCPEQHRSIEQGRGFAPEMCQGQPASTVYKETWWQVVIPEAAD